MNTMTFHAMLASLACALPLAAVAGPTTPAAFAPEVVAYYPGWKSADFPVNASNIRAGNVSLIQYAFADICWDGEHGNPAPEGGGVGACLDAQGQPFRPANGSIVLPTPPCRWSHARSRAIAWCRNTSPCPTVTGSSSSPS